jgi:hypothetical protein
LQLSFNPLPFIDPPSKTNYTQRNGWDRGASASVATEAARLRERRTRILNQLRGLLSCRTPGSDTRVMGRAQRIAGLVA